MLPIQTILVPVDFSECSQHGLHFAIELAHDYRAQMMLLYVDRPPRFAPIATDLTEQLRSLCGVDPGPFVQFRVEEGDPAKSILKVADECKCSLIVMGTHGRTGLDRWLSRSVAEHVVSHARCPVLLVPLAAPDIHPTPECTLEHAEANA